MGERCLVRRGMSTMPDASHGFLRFICSSNNNISRITKMVKGLCNHYSPPLLSLPDPNDSSLSYPYHPFPPPSVLAQPDVSNTLRALGFGYRAAFIQRTASFLVSSYGSDTLLDDPSEASERRLRGLRGVSTAEAREALLKLTGVGRKVADCILLMSLDKVRDLFSDLKVLLEMTPCHRKKLFLWTPMCITLLSSIMG